MGSEWFEVSARLSNTYLSVAVTAAEMPAVGGVPWILDDGTDVYELIRQDRIEELPFPVVFRPPSKGTRRGDMLWTTGTTKIASQAMISALQSIGTIGYTTFPVDVRDHQDRPIDGYVGLSVFSSDSDDDVRQLIDHNFVFLAKPHVIAALRVHGADDLDIRRFDAEALAALQAADPSEVDSRFDPRDYPSC